MMDPPETRYARCGEIHIAYQATGDGSRDIVFVPESISHVEVQWEQPRIARVLERLMSMGRLIMFDQRGCGLSDPTSGPTSVATWLEDLEVVLDAARAERIVFIGVGSGCVPGILLASKRAQMVDRMVLLHGWARLRKAADYPFGLEADLVESAPAYTEQTWGSGDHLRYAAPEHASDPAFVEWFARFGRVAASPGTARRFQRIAIEIDVRDSLASVTAPTLVLHREELVEIGLAHAEYLAEELANATLTVLPGSAALYFTGDPEEWLCEAEAFITGAPRDSQTHRELSTILACDIVESTTRATDLGDDPWRLLLDRHDHSARREIDRFGGRDTNVSGDEIVARFANPSAALRCAQGIRDASRTLDLDVRIGIHTGEVDVSAGRIKGLAVEIARQVMALAPASEILVSRTVADLVIGSETELIDAGEPWLAVIERNWRVYRLANP